MKQTTEINKTENMNRFASIERTLNRSQATRCPHPSSQNHPTKEPVHANAITAANATAAAGLRAQIWSCRVLTRKKAVTQQHIANAARNLDVILLQETLTDASSLPGFRVRKEPLGGSGVCTLVRKGLTFIEHELHNNIKVEHILTEIIPGKKRKRTMFLLNVCSNPSLRK